MRVFGLNRSFQPLARHEAVELAVKEPDRLRALVRWKETGDGPLVSRTFGVSRATLSR
jgi:hypothetical protein